MRVSKFREAQVIEFVPHGLRNKDAVGHKTCHMVSIVEDLRINVFGNGQYLHSEKLIAPDGNELDPIILDIQKVSHLELF